MRLSSLELQGFKSFADRTRLEFNDGITAVVGPNGSGKSNIADAVRWVLGEQSTRALRGGQMQDVIFSGTQARKSVGYASVELTIEDSTGVLAKQGDRVSIGRRLYRSGESEYRINGELVRLRDVHELFMDTGLGRDGYSIIGQGKIADIVSARSEERREIFEEAAGIAKFRYRRTDAQRRLKDTQENLYRLNDILAELEERVEPLRVQSEKASRFLSLAEERKELEISLWVHQLEELKTQIKEQQEQAFLVKNSYEQSQRISEEMEEKLAETFRKMQQLVVFADEGRKEIRSFEEEKSRNEAQIAVEKNNETHNRTRLDTLGKEQGTIFETEEKTKEILTVKEKELGELEAAFLSLTRKLDKQRQEVGFLQEKKERQEEEMKDLSAEKNSLEAGLAQLHLEQVTSLTLLAENTDRLNQLQSSDNEHNHLVAEHEANISHLTEEITTKGKEILSLENEKKGFLLKRTLQMDRYSVEGEKREKLVKQLEQTSSRCRLLKDMEASMEGYAGSVRHILKAGKSGELAGVFGPVSSLISMKPEYSVAIETALGGGLQNIVVRDESVAKQGIALLRSARAGRATFLPLTSVKGKAMHFHQAEKHLGFIGGAADLVDASPEFQGIVDQLLGRICIVDDLDTGTLIAREAGYRFRIVTLDGQVINAGGSFTGGTVSKSGGVLGRRYEIKELESTENEIKNKIHGHTPLLEEITQKVAEIDANLRGLDGEIKTKEEDRVHVEAAHAQQEKARDAAIYRQQLAHTQLKNLEERLSDIQAGKYSKEELILENDQMMKGIVEKLTAAEKVFGETQKLLEEVGPTISSLQIAGLQKGNEIEAVKGDCHRLVEQRENADLHGQQLTKEMNELTEKNQEIFHNIENLNQRQEQLAGQISDKSKRIQDQMETRTRLEQSTTQLRKEEREISQKREEISKQRVRLEERQLQTQERYDQIIGQLWDEYQMTRSHAIETATFLESLEESEVRLKEIRKAIRRLGSVNLEAVEEYKDVKERYEFLSVQLKDVESSRSQLASMIEDLTVEMQELFVNTFEKINKEFSKVFVELFSGGQAELRLGEQEDVLEAGIEIHVQPPGKVIKNLSLLSGGEQAFVAIAIYFAILKVTPSPFVLLDEIEAALDDVNVVRFAEYLRSLSHQTQFIVITHRRGTMEEADVLYGVTMQEEGVSKLLELNLQEVESKLGMGGE